MEKDKLIKLDEQQEEFVSQYAKLGFTNPNEMVNKALQLLKDKIARHTQLTLSAELYTELYDQDKETQEWTEATTKDWID